jgi:polyhydroxybutyrate depolymerase
VRVGIPALVTLLVLAGCVSRRDGNTDPAPVPAPSSPGVAVGTSTGTLTVGGRQRTYRVYRPAGLPEPAPVVLVLHGAVGTARQAQESYGWDAEADAGKFLVVYPDGVRRTWNADPDCCGAAAAENVDDVGFLSRLAGSFGPLADRSRIFATGISNGAMMAYRLACDTDLLAAIAPVAGTMINDCADPRPLSVLAVHGTADRTVPYGGGPGRRDNAGAGTDRPAKIDGPPIPDLLATWRAIDGCGPPETTTAGAVTTSTAACPDGRTVRLLTVAGAGHQWPGGREAPVAQRLLGLDPPSTALAATPTIWRFFADQP